MIRNSSIRVSFRPVRSREVRVDIWYNGYPLILLLSLILYNSVMATSNPHTWPSPKRLWRRRSDHQRSARKTKQGGGVLAATIAKPRHSRISFSEEYVIARSYNRRVQRMSAWRPETADKDRKARRWQRKERRKQVLSRACNIVVSAVVNITPPFFRDQTGRCSCLKMNRLQQLSWHWRRTSRKTTSSFFPEHTLAPLSWALQRGRGSWDPLHFEIW